MFVGRCQPPRRAFNEHANGNDERERHTTNTPFSNIIATVLSSLSSFDIALPSSCVRGMMRSKSTSRNTPADGGTKLYGLQSR